MRISTLTRIFLLGCAIWVFFWTLASFTNNDPSRTSYGYTRVGPFAFYKDPMSLDERKRIGFVDSFTFDDAVGDYSHATDKNVVYCEGKKIKGSDPKTFQYIDTNTRTNLFKDKNYLYIGCERVPNIGPGNITYRNGYVWDDQHVIYLSFGEDEFVAVEGSDIETFNVIGRGYAVDAGGVFFNGKKIETVSGKIAISLELLPSKWNTYAVTTDAVYYNGAVVSGANASRFEYIDIDTAPILSGTIYGGSYQESLFQDGNRYYYEGKALQGSELDSFQILDDLYTKTDSAVYYRNNPVTGADAKTFHVGKRLAGGEVVMKDKNYEYKAGKIYTESKSYGPYNKDTSGLNLTSGHPHESGFKPIRDPIFIVLLFVISHILSFLCLGTIKVYMFITKKLLK